MLLRIFLFWLGQIVLDLRDDGSRSLNGGMYQNVSIRSDKQLTNSAHQKIVGIFDQVRLQSIMS